jgi:hypothetical protein
LLILFYSQIVVMLVGLPIILGMAGGNWFVAFTGLAAFLLLTLPVGMVLHARA